jgi:hypothetical protein
MACLDNSRERDYDTEEVVWPPHRKTVPVLEPRKESNKRID